MRFQIKEKNTAKLYSDALAVQSRGPKVLSPKLVFGSQQMFWDFTKSWVPIWSLFQSLGVPISLGDIDIVEIVLLI